MSTTALALAPLRTHEDHLSAADFARLSRLIHDTVGIKLPPSKRLMVESRLRKRFRHLGDMTFDRYCRQIFDGDGLEQEMAFLIDAITTNKTDFFREPDHLRLMERQLVPDLLAQRRERKPQLKIWSAASSNGAEAYSIAMILADLAEARGDFGFAILGTDISTAMLRHGQQAIYTEEVVGPVPPAMRARHLMSGVHPRRRGQVRIVPELRRTVRFQRLNLMDKTYPVDRDIDIIFLRNVLIYFDKSDQDAVVTRMIEHLRPNAYLIVGHSESMVVDTPAMQAVGPGVFRKC